MKMTSAVAVLVAASALSVTLAMWNLGRHAGPEVGPARGGAGRDARQSEDAAAKGRGTGSGVPESRPARAGREPDARGGPTATGQGGAVAAVGPAPAGGAEPAAPEPIVAESLARNAMRLVGKDPVAEAIWLRAINDPHMPKNARVDLIEDIADEGFSSPMTKADLPLVEARLRLIERLTPLAMDEVNRVSFGEAYKDLLATLARLQGAGGR